MVFETVDIKIINTKNMNSLIDGDQGSLEKRVLVSLLKPGQLGTYEKLLEPIGMLAQKPKCGN